MAKWQQNGYVVHGTVQAAPKLHTQNTKLQQSPNAPSHTAPAPIYTTDTTNQSFNHVKSFSTTAALCRLADHHAQTHTEHWEEDTSAVTDTMMTLSPTPTILLTAQSTTQA